MRELMGGLCYAFEFVIDLLVVLSMSKVIFVHL